MSRLSVVMSGRRLAVLGGCLIGFGLVLLFIFLLKGETTLIGGYQVDKANTTIRCDADGLKYDYFNTYVFLTSHVQINLIMQDDEVSSISLTYTESYNNQKDAGIALSAGHANMNISFGDAKLGADAFSANYSIIDNQARLGLYATSKELNSKAARGYFLMNEGLHGEGEIKKNYEDLGFKCIVKGEQG